MKIIAFILLVGLGMLMVIKTEWFLNFFGRSAWAEKTFGFYGGSRIFYKLLGVIVIIVSTLTLTGVMEKIILSIFAPAL